MMCARIVDCLGDRNVVGPRSCEAIKLVHDDVVDLMFFRMREHSMESWTIGATSRLAAVHELGAEKDTECNCQK